MDADDLRLIGLAARISGCSACPRLAAARRSVDSTGASWSRPVPGFGDARARIHVLGLATAPHGGNRTGRAFTGNRSADTLVAALHRTGLANQRISRHIGDGLRLRGAWMASAVRCPPPDHRPTRAEQDACPGWLTEEVAALPGLAVMVCLGLVAWEAACDWSGIRPRPPFAPGAEHVTATGLVSYSSALSIRARRTPTLGGSRRRCPTPYFAAPGPSRLSMISTASGPA